MAALIGIGVILLLALGSVIYLVMIYNGLISLRNNGDKALSNIDVLLKQRFDELPKLVKVCEGYMQHERGTLEAVIKARGLLAGGGSPAQNFDGQNMLSQALKSLFAVSENYPELKADQSFRQLQSRITELENQIADRREFYNDAVTLYNTRIEQIPDVFIARPMGFVVKKLWEIGNAAQREDVEIRFNH